VEKLVARLVAPNFIYRNQLILDIFKLNGGETGIRTLDTLRYTRFPSVRLQPLGHLSAVLRASLNLTQLALTKGVARPPQNLTEPA
jgi:hypothetical protein